MSIRGILNGTNKGLPSLEPLSMLGIHMLPIERGVSQVFIQLRTRTSMIQILITAFLRI